MDSQPFRSRTAGGDRKGIAFSVADLLAADEQRRGLMDRADNLRRERNALARAAGETGARRDGVELARLKMRAKDLHIWSVSERVIFAPLWENMLDSKDG